MLEKMREGAAAVCSSMGSFVTRRWSSSSSDELNESTEFSGVRRY